MMKFIYKADTFGFVVQAKDEGTNTVLLDITVGEKTVKADLTPDEALSLAASLNQVGKYETL